MRIVFLGSGEFGVPTLGALSEQHEVALVVTQPDRPAGRHRRLAPTPIAAWAGERGLNVLKPERINKPEILEQIRAARADANIVVAFGQKIGDGVIASPRLGRVATMNLHASLLPKYRGAAPIHWAILRGETITGNTIFSLIDRMDAGDILGVQSTPIDPRETTGELHDRLAAMGPTLVLEVLSRLESGTLHPEPQDESQATLAPKLGRADAVIDFTASAEQVRCRVHGLTPWPGVAVQCGTHQMKLCRIEVVEAAGRPGEMVADGVIAVGNKAVRVLEVQPTGKRVMTWAEFNRGARVVVGSQFSPRV